MYRILALIIVVTLAYAAVSAPRIAVQQSCVETCPYPAAQTPTATDDLPPTEPLPPTPTGPTQTPLPTLPPGATEALPPTLPPGPSPYPVREYVPMVRR